MITAGLNALYPPLCLSCKVETDSSGLCASCWRDTSFITGSICDCCSRPLPGNGDNLLCDGCIAYPQVWDKGRAAVLYSGAGRKIALSLKHGDRLDMGKTMAAWMAACSGDFTGKVDIVAPVPLHWTRMLKRKYNQAAILSLPLSKQFEAMHIPDLLLRKKRTLQQKGMSRADRFENQRAAISVNPRFKTRIKNARILLVDDVMTTGATLSACADACKNSGSANVNTLVFARVADGV